jgi:hypothetical protein
MECSAALILYTQPLLATSCLQKSKFLSIELMEYRKKILFFDIQGRYIPNTTYFHKPEDIKQLLEDLKEDE